MNVFQPATTSQRITAVWHGAGYQDSDVWARQSGASKYNAGSGQVTGMKFYTSSGPVAYREVQVYGLTQG